MAHIENGVNVHASCIVFLKESDNGAEKMLASVHHEVEDDDLTTCELFFASFLSRQRFHLEILFCSSEVCSYSDLFEEVGKESISEAVCTIYVLHSHHCC